MSPTFASSSGSVENLNVSVRHGWMFHFFQNLATVTWLIPSAPPSSRDDQCVTPSVCGGGSSVRTTISASSTRPGRPERGWSSSAATPPVAYRSRHRFGLRRR